MKLAITGKGGVGKTTLTSLLAHHYASQNFKVLAIDADPSPCLGASLGFPRNLVEALTPIAEMEELIYERTDAKPGTYGGYFKLNPRVDDIPDRFVARHRGIALLELGSVEKGGSGCICPESVLLKQLVSHILLRRDEVVLMDMYAGVEHLERATADGVDAMLVVAEPTARSLATASQIKSLANDIGIKRKVQSDEDRTYIESHSPDLAVLGFMPYTNKAQQADRDGVAIYDASDEMQEAVRGIVGKIEKVRV
ncbi:MAG: AAA family ATPase [Chloroflexi bacterium]|nr:AAA family ATPase [Chloroflexota bacterium]